MRTRHLAATVSVALLAGALGACGDEGEREPRQPVENKGLAAPGASAEFVAPKNGAETGSTVTARVKLSNFVTDEATVGQPAKQGRGHLHFTMDDGRYDFPKYSGANGKLAQTLGVAGRYSPATEPKITYRRLPPGSHTLGVQLANNDHTNTGVVASTTFIVR
jgi:hypothetical protein